MSHLKLFIFTLIIATVQTGFVVAQNNQIKIKIDANIDGKTIQIDTSINNLGDFNLDAYLKQLGIDEQMSELNINIDNSAPYNFSFNMNDSAFQNMMQNLKDIEIPPMPPVPPMPFTGSMMFKNDNKAFLGVISEKVKDGVQITEVVDSSAAFYAGLIKGDVITKINEKTVESSNNLIEILGDFNPGDKVEITYMRDGKINTTSATLKENKNYFDSKEWKEYGKEWENWGNELNDNWKENMNEEEKGYLGVFLNESDAGVKIDGIDKGSAAEEAGLKEGDIITKIDGVEMKAYNDVVQTIRSKKPGDKVEITFLRDGKENKITATLKGNKVRVFEYNNEEGSNVIPPAGPQINIFPCPPAVNAYAYSISNGKDKNINMSIRIIKKDEANTPADAKTSQDENSILNPESIQFYPNPNTGTFNLKFKLDDSGDTKIIIRDVKGNIVYNEELKNFEGSYDKTISLPDRAKGTYFINISQNNYSATKQIVIQ